MPIDLTTTNILLGIMAGVSVLQGLIAIALLVSGVVLFRGTLRAVERLERQQVSPAMTRVNEILDNVKGVTESVRAQSGRIDRLADWAVEALRKRHRAAREASPKPGSVM